MKEHKKKPKTYVLDFFFFGISICRYIDIPIFKLQPLREPLRP